MNIIHTLKSGEVVKDISGTVISDRQICETLAAMMIERDKKKGE